MHPLFEVLREHRITTLKVRHDWQTVSDLIIASVEWSREQRFSRYGWKFCCETELTSRPHVFGDSEARQILLSSGGSAVLEHLLGMMRKGRHQGVDFWIHPTRSIVVISNMHSNTLGLGNHAHAIRAGGIRRCDPSEQLEDVLSDGMNLARGMSFKNAAAQIPFGGSKICVISDHIDPEDMEAMGFIAWCIDRSRSFTGPDMGFEPRHADALREHFTLNIVGGSEGALGPTGGPTAHGVFLAINAAVAHHLDRPSLKGLKVALQGLGEVGAPLGRALLKANVAELRISDTNNRRVAWFLSTLDAEAKQRTNIVEADQVLFEDVDIVSPNAIGGVFGRDEIDRLRCRIVMGGANNQLVAASQEEEIELAEHLAAQGILYQIDWMHNTAGVIAGCEEWRHGESAQMDRVINHLGRVCRDAVRINLDQARTIDCTPTELAYQRIEQLIYPEERPRSAPWAVAT